MPHVPGPKTLTIALAAVLACVCGQVSTAAAQQAPSAAQAVGQAGPAQPGTAAAPSAVIIPDDRNAAETREQFEALLERYPPTLARVFKLDPSLMSDPAYITPYPNLAAFLSAHPEIVRSPRYFLENISSGEYTYRPPTKDERVLNMWENLLAGVAVFLGLTAAVATLAWLVRTFLDYRRWLRLSKVQVEMNTKLFDRLTANEDLLSYIQTPAGRSFLEAAPIAIEPAGSTIGSPARRVLWAVQAGLVLAAGGIGLLVVSSTTPPEVAQAIDVIGVLAVSLGIGFVLSAAVAFVLSKRLGLLDRPAATDGGRTRPPGA